MVALRGMKLDTLPKANCVREKRWHARKGCGGLLAAAENPAAMAGTAVCRYTPEVGAGWSNDHVRICPTCLSSKAWGIGNASELMVAGGENPHWLRSEASFAMMCGACPTPRRAGRPNATASTAAGTDQRTQAYVARRT